VETQIAHSVKKAKNAAALAERVEKDEERQADNLKTLEEGADDIKRMMERQRKKSQASGKALSKADLDEYRNL
jgi:structural maintenance of chromosome 1